MRNIICGDFNISDENCETESREFLDLMEMKSFCQLVKGETHKDGVTLDLIFIRNDDVDIDDLCFNTIIYL